MWQKYLNFYQTTLTEEVTNHTINKLLSGDKDAGCLVVCDENDQPIGFLTYIVHFSTWRLNPVCYLHDLFVEENYRKNGAATTLLNKLKEIGNSSNWKSIYWMTKPNNNIARIFYEKVAQGENWIRYAMPLNIKA
jgi:GNAT superfamily N-acetyltransferase